MNESSPLWAAYLEMTHGEGEGRSRVQWIITPPVPAPVARPLDLNPIEHPAVFHRRQERRTHKTTWRVKHLNTDIKIRELRMEIAELERRGWDPKQVITCQVHPLEMQNLAREGWKTPYRLITRFERVAETMYGFRIKI